MHVYTLEGSEALDIVLSGDVVAWLKPWTPDSRGLSGPRCSCLWRCHVLWSGISSGLQTLEGPQALDVVGSGDGEVMAPGLYEALDCSVWVHAKLGDHVAAYHISRAVEAVGAVDAHQLIRMLL